MHFDNRCAMVDDPEGEVRKLLLSCTRAPAGTDLEVPATSIELRLRRSIIDVALWLYESAQPCRYGARSERNYVILKLRFGSLALFSGALLLAAGSPASAAAPQTTGPYAVVIEEDPSLPGHTIYRPQNLSAVEGKLPVIAWGNGACAAGGDAFANYLAEFASYGMVAVANGTLHPPAGARTVTKQLVETLDWAEAQNASLSSRYHNKLDLSAMAVSGQSCGGLQALEAAADPRVTTAVIYNSGIIRDLSAIARPDPNNPSGPPRLPPGLVLPGTPATLKKLHTPVIYIIGGEPDIAYKNSEADYAEIDSVPLFKADLPVGHGGTVGEPHGGKFGEVGRVWLLWQLKHDQKAKAMFAGDNCGLCQASGWKVKRKNWM